MRTVIRLRQVIVSNQLPLLLGHCFQLFDKSSRCFLIVQIFNYFTAQLHDLLKDFEHLREVFVNISLVLLIDDRKLTPIHYISQNYYLLNNFNTRPEAKREENQCFTSSSKYPCGAWSPSPTMARKLTVSSPSPPSPLSLLFSLLLLPFSPL